MSTPSPFEIGRAVGSNVSGAIRDANETSALDEILSQANQSQDPQEIQNVMGQILNRVSPEKREVASQILQNKQQQLIRQNQRRALQAQGFDPSLADLDPGIQKELIKNKAENKGANSALHTLQRMREIQSTGHLGGKVNIIGTGRKFGSTLSGEGQRLRSEYERLGKSLIQSSTTIPIRNRQEFETLAHDLYDVTKSNEEILGTLDAMERIIRQSAEGGESAPQNQQSYVDQKSQDAPKSSKNEFVQMKDPSGIIRNIPSNQVQAAQKAGGVLVK